MYVWVSLNSNVAYVLFISNIRDMKNVRSHCGNPHGVTAQFLCRR